MEALNDIPNATEILTISKDESPSSLESENKDLSMEKFTEKYFEMMLRKIKNAVENMKNQKKSKSIVLVDFHENITFEGKSIKIHTLQYGFIEKSKNSWNHRKLYDDEDKMPFRLLQKSLFDKGFYLLDESDNRKSHKPMVILYAEKPENYDIRTKLWHSMNILL